MEQKEIIRSNAFSAQTVTADARSAAINIAGKTTLSLQASGTENNISQAEVSSIVALAKETLDGTYFVVEDDVGTVAIWFDGTGATAEPAGVAGEDRAIEIDVSAAADAAAVAALIVTAIDGDAKFLAALDPADGDEETVLITSSSVGVRADIVDGTQATTMTLAVVTQGVDVTASSITMKLEVSNDGTTYTALASPTIALSGTSADIKVATGLCYEFVKVFADHSAGSAVVNAHLLAF